MKIVYADPPYIGQAKKHYSHDPNCAEVDHNELLAQLVKADGWALSVSSTSLKRILSMPNCPENVRIGSWVKPFSSFKPGVNPAYAWEPVLFMPARKHGREVDTARDWVSANITLERGLSGAKPKPTKEAKGKRVPVAKRKKILEKQLADIAKMIIAWRDGQVCVMGQIDGARCGNGLMWNHFIAQGQSAWMRHDLGNIYWGCGSHNLLDKWGDPILGIWVQDTLGSKAVLALRAEAKAHVKMERTEYELEQLLAHYDELYQNRFYVNLDLQSLIKAGYYGEIVRLALA